MHMNETKNGNAWWPKIATIQEAAECAKVGVILAAFCGVVTGSLALLALAGHSFLGVRPWALVDAAIFAALAYGISRSSKSAALFAPIFYAAERIYEWGHSAVPSTLGAILALSFLLGFINGARGVFAVHRFTKVVSA